MHHHRLFGLIGYPLTHSFSKKYFTAKFEAEGLSQCRYELFPLETIEALPALLAANPSLEGLNVTIPYKQSVQRFLDETEEEAQAVGAVNTIKICRGRLTGYNTDVFGFEQSLKILIGNEKPAALVLGTGGASKAVLFVLKKLDIPYLLVSRSGEKADLTYAEISAKMLKNYRLIINSTPLGMFPDVDRCPALPYTELGNAHFAFDLVYNPEQTLFIKMAAAAGAKTLNGLPMLHLQAEKAWEIWNNKR